MATNTFLNNDVILKYGLMYFYNNLVACKVVGRDYEAKFGGNSAKVGDTIRIARPIRGQVREGRTMQVQDITEGRTALAVANQIGADLEFTTSDLTLKVDDFADRILKPQMIQLANYVDLKVVTELTNQSYHWVGTAGNVIDSAADFFKGPERLDNMGVPTDSRIGMLSPGDYWGLAGNLTGLYLNDVASSALKKAKLPMLGNVEMYMSQNVLSHTNGNWGASAMAITGSGTALAETYAAAKDRTYFTQSTQINGFASSASTYKAGDVFTISGVYAVNPITKAAQDFLQQFTVQADGTADGTGVASISFAPAIIISGPYQTVSAAPVAGSAVTWKGTAASVYKQSLVFHKDAATLAMPALMKPQGAAWCETRTYEGISLRLTQGYDIINDVPQWRFDALYGVLAHNPGAIARVSGT